MALELKECFYPFEEIKHAHNKSLKRKKYYRYQGLLFSRCDSLGTRMESTLTQNILEDFY